MLYKHWIDTTVPNTCTNLCIDYQKLMLQVFPELLPVNGIYYDHIKGTSRHWWCKTKDNIIIDPTAKQFPSNGKGIYEAWPRQKHALRYCHYCHKQVGNYKLFCFNLSSNQCERYYIIQLARLCS